jgi:hypothetical protein
MYWGEGPEGHLKYVNYSRMTRSMMKRKGHDFMRYVEHNEEKDEEDIFLAVFCKISQYPFPSGGRG